MNKISDPCDLSDLKPISILSELPKVLEKIMGQQLDQYLMKKLSAYTNTNWFSYSEYSCTSVLLNISNDIIQSIDSKNGNILLLLDFSKVFNTCSV